MKRILSLFLVGILLLPSLFACGKAPQATATETTPAITEIPAIEIGESGSTHEDYKIEIVEYAWSAEEAWFILEYTRTCSSSRNWNFFIQRKNGEAWEDVEEEGAYLSRIYYLSPYIFFMHSKLKNNPITLLGLNHLYDFLDNGDYRLFITYQPEENEAAETVSPVEMWANFSLTGMTPKKYTDVAFSAHIRDYLGLRNVDPVLVFRSTEEWYSFCDAYNKEFGPAIKNKDDYNEDYFKDRILILATLYLPSSGTQQKVEFVRAAEDGTISLRVETTRIGASSDNGGWTIYIEPEAGVTVNGPEDVSFYLDGHEYDKIYPRLYQYCGYECDEIYPRLTEYLADEKKYRNFKKEPFRVIAERLPFLFPQKSFHKKALEKQV